ncbi:MAG: sigma-70 family RNA polymerase sigma factor [Caldiserica bacterium]|nr:sigma-70 family RNA polymerase sigma factor [Caldisericota bacterium]
MNRKVNDREDDALIKAFMNDENNAFDKLVLKYKDRVFNLCFRILGDYEEADDCAQDAFVKVYRALHRFRFEAAFSTYLYRVAVNTCKNKLKSKEYRHSKKMLRLSNPKEERLHAIEIRDESLSPLTQLERKEKEEIIQEAISSLPAEQRNLIVLRDIEGLSYEEIVRVTGYKLGTVKSKIARARQKLRDKLKGLV